MPTRDPNAPARVAPLAPMALAVVAGVAADRALNVVGTFAWLALGAAFTALLAVSLRRERLAAVAILGVFATGSGAWHHSRWSDLASNDLARVVDETPRPAWLRGVIRDVNGFRAGRSAADSGVTRGVLEVVEIRTPDGWRSASGRAAFTVSGDRSDLLPGTAVETAGGLALVAPPLNPGEFDYRAYLQGQGVRLRLSVDDPSGIWPDESEASSGWPWLGTRTLGAVRAWSQRTLAEGFDARTAPLASALLLGRREGVDPDVNDAFARTGTTHLLAISGLHMQVLALALGFVLRAAGCGRRRTFQAVILATVAYTLLVGLMPSVVRSAVMTVTVCSAGLFDRQNHNGNSFAAAVMITLLHNPSDLFDVGCQLSFLAVAAIVWIVPLLLGLRRKAGRLDEVERELAGGWRSWVRLPAAWLAEGVAVSVVVWLAAVPLTALRFHVASPISVLLNLPLIPMTSGALLASGVSLGLSAVWTPLGRPAAWVASWLLKGTEWVVLWGSAQHWGHAFVPGPSSGWVLGFYLLAGLSTIALASRWRLRVRWAWAVALAGWVGLAVGVWLRPGAAGPLRAEVLAVGHGLAVVIETGGGHAVLYDCGRMRDPSVGRRVVAPALWSRGVRRLDAVVLSHADADHYNGLPDLLDRFSVGEVLVPEGFGGETNPNAVDLLRLVRSRGVTIRTVVAGESWTAGPTRFLVRHPPRDWTPGASDNARSIVLEVSSRGRALLLTGDLEGEGLHAFKGEAGSPPDAFLAPHHGGRASNPSWLYDQVHPRLVVVSQRPPQPGSKDALAALGRQGTPLLRTWDRGAIRLSWTDSGVVAHGFLDGRKP